MRYLTLVSDYDGTLATDDHIADETALALEYLRTSGRKIILVTGRRLDSLLEVCGNQKLFDLIVAENGAVIYDPLTREEVVLANPPSQVDRVRPYNSHSYSLLSIHLIGQITTT